MYTYITNTYIYMYIHAYVFIHQGFQSLYMYQYIFLMYEHACTLLYVYIHTITSYIFEYVQSHIQVATPVNHTQACAVYLYMHNNVRVLRYGCTIALYMYGCMLHLYIIPSCAVRSLFGTSASGSSATCRTPRRILRMWTSMQQPPRL